MKKLTNSRFLAAFLVLALFSVLVSSCQRGYGCPYKFQAKSEVKK
jgi:hypothetical protein